MNGVTTGFLYDGAQAIAELKGSSLDTVYHTGVEIDEVLARYAPLGNKTLLTDALMSVIAQANDDETVSNYYAYSPYGETTVLGPDEGNALQYTGRENDGTGLYYYRARYYDPGLKRFISADPLGTNGGANLYSYVSGSPLNFLDPFGLRGRGGYFGGKSFMELITEFITGETAEGMSGAQGTGKSIGDRVCSAGGTPRGPLIDCADCIRLFPESESQEACFKACRETIEKCTRKDPTSSCPVPGIG